MNREFLTVSFAVLRTLPMQSYATGRMQCEPIDKAAWITDAELEDKLVAEGWMVQELRVARRGKILFRAEGVN